MGDRIIIAGGGGRGLMFTHMLNAELQRSVAAIAEINKDVHPKIRQSLREWNLPNVALFDSLEKALSTIPRSQADIVFVMTPDWTHRGVVETALAAGCHLFLEKPLATTRPDVLEIMRLAHTTNQTIQVGFVLRYSAFYRKVKEIVESGILGQLVMIQMNERLGLLHGAGFCRSWHRKVQYTGGFLNEKCSHDLDLLCWFKEGQAAPAEIFSYGGRHFTPPRNTPTTCNRCRLRTCPYRQKAKRCVYHSDADIMDHQSVTIRFTDGTQGLFSVAAMSPVPGRDIRIFGTTGYLEGMMEEGTLRVRYYEDGSEFRDIGLGATGGHGGGDTRIVAEFLDCVDRHERPASTVRDGARASLLAFAAEESVKTGKAVPLGAVLRPLTETRRKADAALTPLTGRGFDQNLVMRGSRGRDGFDFMVGNPTAWPINVLLRFEPVTSFLRERVQNNCLPLQNGAARLTLQPHERRDLRLDDRNGKLLGASASVMPDKADELKRFAEERLALYRRIETLDDKDLEKALSFVHADETVETMRAMVRVWVSAGKKKNWLTIANQTSRYITSKLGHVLRLIPPTGARKTRQPVPFSVACGSSESFQDADGRLWLATQPWVEGLLSWGYVGGEHFARGSIRIRETRNPRLYQNEHWGLAGYRFRIANGKYKVRLHFMEAYDHDLGQRRFDVLIQGQPVLKNLDVYKTAGGSLKAWTKTFAVDVTNGLLAIDFSPTHMTMINGIEVQHG